MEPLDKFRDLRKIGEGGMGEVFRAWDTAIGRDVAIKFVRLTGEGNAKDRADFAARLRREGQAAGNLSHPNIVTIYDFVEQPDKAFIVMEFVDGQSLDAWLADLEIFGPHVVLDIVRKAATALDYAHSKGVIHRDVKPSNILIRNDGDVKLVDFGLAKVSSSSRLTQSGSAIGTPHYMSAEQIDSDTVDARSDQYSLAVCAYEMMTGARPFTGGSLHNLFHKILNADPAPPPELNPSLGKEIGTVLMRALSKNPADRYASCLAFATALERACATTPSWRPKAPTVAVVAQPGRGGAGGGPAIATETPMPAPLDLNKLAQNLDPWLTEAISPRSVTLPPAPPPAPPPNAPPIARKSVEPPAPPPESSAKRYGIIAATLVVVAGLIYMGLSMFSGKPAAAPPATPPPVVIQQAPVQEPKAPPKKAKPTAKHTPQPKAKTKPAEESAAEPAAKPADPMDLLSRPAAPIPTKRKQ